MQQKEIIDRYLEQVADVIGEEALANERKGRIFDLQQNEHSHKHTKSHHIHSVSKILLLNESFFLLCSGTLCDQSTRRTRSCFDWS